MRFKGETKPKAGSVCLAVAVALFLSDGLMLCDCPGLLVMAAVFAGFAAWFGSRTVRTWSVPFLIFSVVMAGREVRNAVIAKARMAEVLQQIRRSQASTNTLEQGTNAPQKK